MTEEWFAKVIDTYIFYAAYSKLYKYKKLVKVGRTTGSGTKAFVIDTAGTLEKAQIEKISNVPEKGYRIFRINKKKFFAAGCVFVRRGVVVYRILDTVYNFVKNFI